MPTICRFCDTEHPDGETVCSVCKATLNEPVKGTISKLIDGIKTLGASLEQLHVYGRFA